MNQSYMSAAALGENNVEDILIKAIIRKIRGDIVSIYGCSVLNLRTS